MAKPSMTDKNFKAGRAGLSAPFCVRDLGEYLLGHWRVERRVFDRCRGEIGTFSGELCFESGPGGLRATETGRMIYGETETDAERVLLYHFEGSTRARVLFSDGRFFHELDLGTGRARVSHLCGDDTYIGGFWVVSRDILLQRWRVLGPRKDLVLLGRLRREVLR